MDLDAALDDHITQVERSGNGVHDDRDTERVALERAAEGGPVRYTSPLT